MDILLIAGLWLDGSVWDGAMAFPGWSTCEGPDSADLDDAAKQAIASAAIPVPEGVTHGVVRLADGRRRDVPVVWPMISAPADLVRLLAQAAEET
jgi:hypothetical protein